MKELHRQWGRRVRELRRGLMPDGTLRPDDHAPQMTQADLAERVGVTQQTISGIEKGAAGPGDALKVRIASALGADVWDVFPLVRDEAVA